MRMCQHKKIVETSQRASQNWKCELTLILKLCNLTLSEEENSTLE